MFQRLGGAGIRRFRPRGDHQTTLAGLGLHDPLHGRQTCPEFNSFHEGVGQIRHREGLFSCHPLTEHGKICNTPPPPPIIERLESRPRSATSFSLRKLPVRTFVSHTGVQHSPGSSTIELPSALAESGAYPPDRALPPGSPR